MSEFYSFQLSHFAYCKNKFCSTIYNTEIKITNNLISSSTRANNLVYPSLKIFLNQICLTSQRRESCTPSTPAVTFKKHSFISAVKALWVPFSTASSPWFPQVATGLNVGFITALIFFIIFYLVDIFKFGNTNASACF